MIYITGDCHADWVRFSTDNFPEQKDMTRDDFVIVCGDFGLWHEDATERWWFNWFEQKNFTLLFVDGNHENFDRLYSDEFEVVDFHGGKAHKIRENIYHLMRGYVFDLCGKKFFAFGGASSHDIDDGILEPSDYESDRELSRIYSRLTKQGKLVRINHISWWKEELPSQEEMDLGMQNLQANNNEVDFIISHCAPQRIASLFSNGIYKSDGLTMYFNEVMDKVRFKKWYFGHYHNDTQIMGDFIMTYRLITRIV